MPTLGDVLGGIPGLAGYQAQSQLNEQQPIQQLQQVSGLASLLTQAQQAQEQRRKIAQEQAFRTELFNLGPNATQDQLAKIAAKYAPPQSILTSQTASLDRKASLEVAKEAKAAALEQAKSSAQMAHEVRMSTLTNVQERAAESARHNRAMEGLQGQIAQLRSDQIGIAKTPPGYRPTPEGNLQAIPGGPADTKIQGQLNQDTASLNESMSNMDRLAQEANAIKEHPGLKGITGLRGAIPNIPGTEASNAQARLDTLKSQVGFSVLQNMRNNSKTGGALGQVSNIEEKLLQDNLAGLGRAQSYEEYQKALQRIIDYTDQAKDRLRSAYNMKQGAAARAIPQSVAAPVGAVIDFNSLPK